jgi:ubiquinone biosynthesis protein UbiJ
LADGLAANRALRRRISDRGATGGGKPRSLQAFAQAVDELRDDTQRLDKRIQRLSLPPRASAA